MDLPLDWPPFLNDASRLTLVGSEPGAPAVFFVLTLGYLETVDVAPVSHAGHARVR